MKPQDRHTWEQGCGSGVRLTRSGSDPKKTGSQLERLKKKNIPNFCVLTFKDKHCRKYLRYSYFNKKKYILVPDPMGKPAPDPQPWLAESVGNA